MAFSFLSKFAVPSLLQTALIVLVAIMSVWDAASAGAQDARAAGVPVRFVQDEQDARERTRRGARYLQTLSDNAHVSLLTVLPGDKLYTAFGHSALRVSDPQRGIDRIFNYGTFDYSDPLFIPKFVYGDLIYMLSVARFPAAFRYYTQVEERPVIEQTLNLTPEQQNALFEYLQINALPENKYYAYQFLFDNCSTRARDALTETLKSDVQFTERPDPGRSFRRLLDPYVADKPWLDLGFDIGLGAPADRIPSPAEAVFLPDFLMQSFAYASVRRGNEWQPLVSQTDTLFWVEGGARVTAARNWPSILGWSLLAAVALGMGAARWSSVRIPPRFVRIADALLFGLVGFVGLVVAFLWFIAIHSVTEPNWNVLWAWPTHLIATYLIARGGKPAWLRGYWIATAAATAVVALGWPLWPQDLHAAALPLTLLVGMRSAGRAVGDVGPRSK